MFSNIETNSKQNLIEIIEKTKAGEAKKIMTDMFLGLGLSEIANKIDNVKDASAKFVPISKILNGSMTKKDVQTVYKHYYRIQLAPEFKKLSRKVLELKSNPTPNPQEYFTITDLDIKQLIAEYCLNMSVTRLKGIVGGSELTSWIDIISEDISDDSITLNELSQRNNSKRATIISLLLTIVDRTELSKEEADNIYREFMIDNWITIIPKNEVIRLSTYVANKTVNHTNFFLQIFCLEELLHKSLRIPDEESTFFGDLEIKPLLIHSRILFRKHPNLKEILFDESTTEKDWMTKTGYSLAFEKAEGIFNILQDPKAQRYDRLEDGLRLLGLIE